MALKRAGSENKHATRVVPYYFLQVLNNASYLFCYKECPCKNGLYYLQNTLNYSVLHAQLINCKYVVGFLFSYSHI